MRSYFPYTIFIKKQISKQDCAKRYQRAMTYMPLSQPLPPEVLDALLAEGYYRMRQTVFTTNFIFPDDGTFVEVLWARVALANYQPHKLHRELTRKNSCFQKTLTTGIVDEEIEQLYALYATSVNFDAPETAAAFLQGETTTNYFPTKMWQLRDAGKLIAVSYFDDGKTTAAGIMNFFHPDYKKYSPGKWLYLESIQYAVDTGKTFFYPGYIALDYPKFDYKLIAGKDRIEIWLPIEHQWVPYLTSRHAIGQ